MSTEGYVSLGEAIEELGSRMFSADWVPGQTGELRQRAIDRADTALRNGEIFGGYRILTSAVSEMRPSAWAASNSDWYQLERFKPYDGLSVEGQLFIRKRSLESFLFMKYPQPQTSQEFIFQYEDRRWRLFDALVWVATSGKPTTTAEIADGDLAELGARALFKVMDDIPPLAPKPDVTGLLPRLLQRITIHPNWELLHTGWSGREDEGGKITFRPTKEGVIKADLFENGRGEPSYLDVCIDRDGLFAMFSNNASAAVPNTNAAQPVPTEPAIKPRTPRKPRGLGDVSMAIDKWFVDVHGGVVWPDHLTDAAVADAVMGKFGDHMVITAEQVRAFRRRASKPA